MNFVIILLKKIMNNLNKQLGSTSSRMITIAGDRLESLSYWIQLTQFPAVGQPFQAVAHLFSS